MSDSKINLQRRNGTNRLVPLGWKEKKPKLHAYGGNVAMLDGSVHQWFGGQLQDWSQEPDDKGEPHFIYP
jgi:prepilin-type processing-associated H-X9-DG protein